MSFYSQTSKTRFMKLLFTTILFTLSITILHGQVKLYEGAKRQSSEVAIIKIGTARVDKTLKEIERNGTTFISQAFTSAKSKNIKTWIVSIDSMAIQQFVDAKEDVSKSKEYYLLPGKHVVTFNHTFSGQGIKHAEGDKLTGVLAMQGAWININFKTEWQQDFISPVSFEINVGAGETFVIETEDAYGKCTISILKDKQLVEKKETTLVKTIVD